MQNESRETILSEARSSHVSPEGCFNRPPFAISRNHHHGDWQKVRTSDLHPGLVRVESRQALPPAGRGIRYTVVQKCASEQLDRKSTRLNSSHVSISYAVFCLKKKKKKKT